jgi:hypothetical protein
VATDEIRVEPMLKSDANRIIVVYHPIPTIIQRSASEYPTE